MDLSPGAKLALAAGVVGVTALALSSKSSASSRRTSPKKDSSGAGSAGNGGEDVGNGGEDVGNGGEDVGNGGEDVGGAADGGSDGGIEGIGGAIMLSRDEPEGGWEARLNAEIQNALEVCRKDTDVTTYAEMTECVLRHVFPEAIPWREPSDWEPWMLAARQAAQKAIQDATKEFAGGWGAPGWQFALWLMFDRLFAQCKEENDNKTVDAIADCMAYRIYPVDKFPYTWPPDELNGEDWQRQFYDTLLVKVADALGV